MSDQAVTHRRSASDLAKEALEEKDTDRFGAALKMAGAVVQAGLAIEQRLTEISHTLKARR